MLISVRPNATCVSIHGRCGSHADGAVAGAVTDAEAGGRGGDFARLTPPRRRPPRGHLLPWRWRRTRSRSGRVFAGFQKHLYEERPAA